MRRSWQLRTGGDGHNERSTEADGYLVKHDLTVSLRTVSVRKMGNSVSPSGSPAHSPSLSPVSQFFTRVQLGPESLAKMDDQTSKGARRIARDDVFERRSDDTKAALASSINHRQIAASPKRCTTSAQSTSIRSSKLLDTGSCHKSSARLERTELAPKKNVSDRHSRRKSLDNPAQGEPVSRPGIENQMKYWDSLSDRRRPRRASIDSVYAVLASHRGGAQIVTDSKCALPRLPAYACTQRQQTAAAHLQEKQPEPAESPDKCFARLHARLNVRSPDARLRAVIKLQALQRGRVVRAQQQELRAVEAVYKHLHGNAPCGSSPLSSSVSPKTPGAHAVSTLFL